MTNETKPTATAELEPCPLPIGWTVRLSRMAETDEVEKGIAIHAIHESGQEFTSSVWSMKLKNPVQRLFKSRDDPPSYDPDRVPCDFLWTRILRDIRGWENQRATGGGAASVSDARTTDTSGPERTA